MMRRSPFRKITQFLDLLRRIFELIVVFSPGYMGNTLRHRYYKKKLKFLGDGSIIDLGVQFVNPHHISIGENTWIDKYVVLIAGPVDERGRKIKVKRNSDYEGIPGELTIGKNCHIAPHVVISGHGGVQIGDDCGVASGAKIYSLSHHFRNLQNPEDRFEYRFSPQVPPDQQALIAAPVVMSNYTALGLNAVVLPGVTIGQGSWVGVGSCVVKSIAPGVIAMGNPACEIKKRWD